MAADEVRIPYDIDAERSTLGACLLTEASCFEAASIVKPVDFYIDAHRAIFEAVIELSQTARKADMVTVAVELKKADRLETSGGAAYLAELIDAVASAVNVGQYATRVRECAVLREIMDVSRSIHAKANNNGDAREILNEMQQRLIRMEFCRNDSEPELVSKTMRRIYADLDNPDTATSLTFGIPEVDDKILGMEPGNLIVIGARPSIGKTSLALQVLLHNARSGIACGLFSLEMNRNEIARRLLSMESGISMYQMRSGRVREEDATKSVDAAACFDHYPIVIDDSTSLGAFDLHVRARQMKLRYGLELIAIDYLQLMDVARTENRAQALGDVTRMIKGLARELNVPVLLLSQLNRDVRDDAPKLHNLRDSGAIEADADVCILLHRKKLGLAKASIIIAKQRNGPTGEFDAMFDSGRGMFIGKGQDDYEILEAKDCERQEKTETEGKKTWSKSA